MTEEQIREAFLEHAVKAGVVTFDEIYTTFPPEYSTLEGLYDFLVLLESLGVRVIERQEASGIKRKRMKAA